jgi:hypothetical protein
MPAAALAAVKSEFSRSGGMRLTLDDRTLTAELVETPRYHRFPPTEELLFGKRVTGACGTTFRYAPKSYVFNRRVWPEDARSVTFGFARDLSRRVKWCLVDGADGADVAFVSFVDAEPSRHVAKGRGPSGEWWRLRGWRGETLQPCLMLRHGPDPSYGAGRCFDGLAEREATLGAEVFTEGPDVYVVGVVAREAEAVRVRVADGSIHVAALYPRAPESRVRAQFFVLALPRESVVAGVRAVARDGRTIARRRFDGR